MRLSDKQTVYANKNTENFILKRMKQAGGNGYIKVGVFVHEVIWGGYSYMFHQMTKEKQDSFKKGMFLFGLVRRDAKRYLKKNEIVLPKQYGQIEYRQGRINEETMGKVTGTDLNHAYWRIAYNLGILSEYTYLKGLPNEYKSVRLAALSTLGGNKKYQKIKNGELIDEYMIIQGDEQLQSIYKLIRYTCYRYMNQVKKKLGHDFLCYKTDAIYYIDTKENRKTVRDFFKRNDLLMKQLT